MKKILIISYFYSPCNLTAANRVKNWHMYLPKNGFYPIVVTRNWSGNELNEYQRLESSDSAEKSILCPDSEIYYVPYSSNLRDKCFTKGEKNIFYRIFSKVLTFIYKLLNILPYRNMYLKARQLLKNDSSIKYLLISSNPFEQFLFGFLLKKEFPYIKWVADYRDDWNTTELILKRNLLEKIIFNIEKKREKKWLSNVDAFISVSPYYVKKISFFIKRKGFTVFNGFNKDLIELSHIPMPNKFIITFNGSLYDTQDVTMFLNSYKLIIDKYSSRISIMLNFPGLENDKKQLVRIKKHLMNYVEYFNSSGRIPKKDVINIQLKSDLLLMVAHSNIKGIPSSKMFEYIGLRKQILLCPSDNDILNDIMQEYNSNNIAKTSEECFRILEYHIVNKINKIEPKSLNNSVVAMFSAEYQTKKLAKILDSL